MNNNPNNPLHGITLELIINSLVDKHGWNELGKKREETTLYLPF